MQGVYLGPHWLAGVSHDVLTENFRENGLALVGSFEMTSEASSGYTPKHGRIYLILQHLYMYSNEGIQTYAITACSS